MNYFAKDRLKGKVAIITESTEGIGFGIAQRLAREGASVIISSRQQKNVEKALQKLKSEDLEVVGTVCQIGKAEDRTKLFELAMSQYGGLDILVSNAGVNTAVVAVLDTPENAWEKIFDINVKTSFLLAKEALPYLQKRGKGKIVFVTSFVGYLPHNSFGAYSVSKTALIGLTKAAAQQVAHDNIQVNAVAPGVVLSKFLSAFTSTERERKKLLDVIPMRRFGVPEEMAAAVAFLTSCDSDYITGETIIVAGGIPCRL